MISQSTGSYYPLVAYEYDSQNQLIKETYYDGKGTGSTHVTDTYEYTYDTAGNILSEKKNGTVTKTYTYGDSQWKDLLTEYNGKEFVYEGQTYDYINKTVKGTAKSGNPTGYYNDNYYYYYYMEWKNGSQLSYMSVETGIDRFQTAYDYDADGVRCNKYVDSIEHNYITQNGKVVRETIKNGSSVKVLDFIYDESGRPFALKYSTNGGSSFTTYYYVLNLQGDVVKLVEILASSAGTEWYSEEANYTYDAWGNILSVTDERGNAITDPMHLAHLNPLRYRGYYYDTETGFYYLQSRYYDPATHRFINADGYASTGQGFTGSNMFAYCNNNPIIYSDGNGMIPMIALLVSDGGGGKGEDDEEYEYINDQNDSIIGSLMLSDSVFSATVSHGGCGPVATYNALITLGNPKDFKEVLSYYKATPHTTILWGQLGMLPPAVESYFIDAGYRVEGAWMSDSNYNALDIYAYVADACILWYAYTKDSSPYYGAHFVEFSRVGNTHQYIAHNAGGATAENGVDTFRWVVDYACRDNRFAAYGIFIFKND